MPADAAQRLQAKLDSNAPDLKEFMKSMGILSFVVVGPLKPEQDKQDLDKAPPSNL